MLCRLCFAIIVLCLASPHRAPTRAHDDMYTRRAARVYVGARIERLKLIRVYDQRIKLGTECREKIGNLYAVPCFTFCHHRIRRVYFSIHTLRNRDDRTALSSRDDYCALRCEISTRKCGIAYSRAIHL